MKKNNKGFMLAEAIITAVMITTAMISLYSIFNRLYASYNQNSTYYNVDGVYAARASFNYLFNESESNFNLFINNIFQENKYKVIMDENTCFYNNQVYNNTNTEFTNAIFCKSIKDTYNVNKMILVEYDKTVLEQDVININQTFKEYINFVNGYYDVSENDTRYSYLFLVEIKDGDNYYYANLGVE